MSNTKFAPEAQPTTDTEAITAIADTIKAFVDQADEAREQSEQAKAKAKVFDTSAAEQTKLLLEKVGKTECARRLRARGIGKTRTYDLIAIADGTKTAVDIRGAGAKRKREHDQRKKEKDSPLPGRGNGKTNANNVVQLRPQSPAAGSDVDPTTSAAEMMTALAGPDEVLEPEIEPTTGNADPNEAIKRFGRNLLEIDRDGARVLWEAMASGYTFILWQLLEAEFGDPDYQRRSPP